MMKGGLLTAFFAEWSLSGRKQACAPLHWPSIVCVGRSLRSPTLLLTLLLSRSPLPARTHRHARHLRPGGTRVRPGTRGDLPERFCPRRAQRDGELPLLEWHVQLTDLLWTHLGACVLVNTTWECRMSYSTLLLVRNQSRASSSHTLDEPLSIYYSFTYIRIQHRLCVRLKIAPRGVSLTCVGG